MKEKIAQWQAHARKRIAYWAEAERVAADTHLDSDAAWCAYLRTHFEELLECLNEMERLAA